MLKNFKLFLISLFSLSLIGFLWSIMTFVFLAKLPTDFNQFEQDNNFYNIHLERLFSENTYIKLKPKIIKTKIETLRNVKLKAIYENGKNSFIVIDDKTDIFLNLNQKYKGYKLISVTKNSAIFIKNNKQFKIELSKISSNRTISNQSAKIEKIDEPKEVNKETLISYTKNPSKIWKNIAIVHTYKGYKITYIKRGSIFHKLGLKKGDYILEVNNQKLISDSDAWKIYKNVNKFDEIDIKIKRNNQIKELSYEIN